MKEKMEDIKPLGIGTKPDEKYHYLFNQESNVEVSGKWKEGLLEGKMKLTPTSSKSIFYRILLLFSFYL